MTYFGHQIVKRALHLTLVQAAAAHMPAMLVHRVGGMNCGRRDEDEHEAQWQVTVPADTHLTQIHVCDRHFALFILDRSEFEQLRIEL